MKHNDFTKQGNVNTDANRRFDGVDARIASIPSRFPRRVSNASGDAIKDTGLTKTAHGFSVGTIVFWDSDLETYRLAKADGAETCVYDGVVSNVPDANTFDLTYAGVIKNVDSATYTDGTTYYLSEVTAGNSKDLPPAYTFYQVPVYHCFKDADGTTLNLLVYPGRPLGSSHLALVAGDVTDGGGTARIFSTAAIYWEVNAAGVMSIKSGSNVASLTNAQAKLTDGTNSNTLSPTQSIITDGTTGDTTTVTPAKTTIAKTVASVLTTLTMTPTQLTVGATPASPTAHSDLTASLLSMTSSSAVVAQFSATLLAMTLSATNSVLLQASDITDTSQTISFRKVSICDPATGLVKSTWLPCSTPF